MEGVHLFWEGREEKEGEGVTSDMFFPSSGICLNTQYMGQIAGRMDPGMSKEKGIYVQHLSVRPRCWMQCQAAPTWEHLFRTSFRGQGKWVFQLLLLPETLLSKASCMWYERSFPQGGCLLLVLGSHSDAEVRMSERTNLCAREAPW